MPWPNIPVPNERAPLSARYLNKDGLFVVRLGLPVTVQEKTCFGQTSLPICGKSSNTQCLPNLDAPINRSCIGFCREIDRIANNALGFVAYRQERDKLGAPMSEFIQVSPFIDYAHCIEKPHSEVFIDPYLKLVRHDNLDSWSGTSVVFLDRTGHIESHEYRYQFVYFDDRGEITHYRTSDWIPAISR